MYVEADHIKDYLQNSKYIDWKKDNVQRRAQELAEDCQDEIDLVRRMYHYVRDEIRHSWDAGDLVITVSASQVLEHKTGICYAKANLLAALLRAKQIPCGICYQRLTMEDTPAAGYCIHALNAVYLSTLKKWIRLDARGNKESVCAEMNLEKEQLAFTVRPEYDEIDYREIYAEPLPQIMRVLEQSTDAGYMYQNSLPSQLEDINLLVGKKAIIFDLDGTLIDSVGIWNEVDKKLIVKLGAEPPEPALIQQDRDKILRKYSGMEQPYMEYCGYLREKYNSALSSQEIHKQRYEIADQYLVCNIDYKQKADELIRALYKSGYLLLIATTTKESNMNIYRYKNNNIISKAKLDEYFTHIYTRESVKEIKPNPEVYLKIMEEFNLEPEQCLVFEDSLIGIEAAKNAGIETVAVYDCYSDHERDKINAISDYAFRDFKEILDAI